MEYLFVWSKPDRINNKFVDGLVQGRCNSIANAPSCRYVPVYGMVNNSVINRKLFCCKKITGRKMYEPQW